MNGSRSDIGNLPNVPQGPLKDVEVITVSALGADGYVKPEGFVVQVSVAGKIKVISFGGTAYVLAGLSAGDTIAVAGIPLLCRAVIKDSDTTVTGFVAGFL